MALPTEFDFGVLQIGDGESPEVFTLLCGMENGQINFTANTADRFPRDCAKPGEIPYRKVKATGKQLDVNFDGLTNKANVATVLAVLGVVNNYKALLYADDATDTGTLLGTLAFAAMLTSNNVNVPRDAGATNELTLVSHGAWTWTAA